MRKEASSAAILSVVMVNFNGKRFLDGCLQSILDHATVPWELILLDNGSTDGSADYVLERYPWVHLIRSAKNLGFIAGNNLAARQAHGRYLLLLNVDTILQSDVAPALRILESDARVGIVGARMYGADGAPRPSTGRFPTPMRLWRFASLWIPPDRHSYGDAALHAFQVDWVEGSFLLTTAENWRAIGGLDEANFFYGDDVDFCRATADRGLVTVCCPDVKYIHFGGYEDSRMGYLYAGFRRYHRKYSSPIERFAADMVLRLGLFLRILVYGARYLVTRNAAIGRKWRCILDLNRRWAQTNTAAPRFEGPA